MLSCNDRMQNVVTENKCKQF